MSPSLFHVLLLVCVSGTADSISRAQDLRSEHAEHIAQTKREALEAIDLMSRSVNNKVAQEREKGGLIILAAHYGLASAFSDRGIRRSRQTAASSAAEQAEGDEKVVEEEEVVIDVTVPVQALVVDSKLSIPGGRGKVSLQLGLFHTRAQ